MISDPLLCASIELKDSSSLGIFCGASSGIGAYTCKFGLLEHKAMNGAVAMHMKEYIDEKGAVKRMRQLGGWGLGFGGPPVT
mmetsp:Transcript_40246/g.52993  ORF Transcript_40246/g.52993 Transcript_40246/m.52993 type:complete len:82 (+) Transcript_40246:1267-1512(+)